MDVELVRRALYVSTKNVVYSNFSRLNIFSLIAYIFFILIESFHSLFPNLEGINSRKYIGLRTLRATRTVLIGEQYRVNAP